MCQMPTIVLPLGESFLCVSGTSACHLALQYVGQAGSQSSKMPQFVHLMLQSEGVSQVHWEWGCKYSTKIYSEGPVLVLLDPFSIKHVPGG